MSEIEKYIKEYLEKNPMDCGFSKIKAIIHILNSVNREEWGENNLPQKKVETTEEYPYIDKYPENLKEWVLKGDYTSPPIPDPVTLDEFKKEQVYLATYWSHWNQLWCIDEKTLLNIPEKVLIAWKEAMPEEMFKLLWLQATCVNKYSKEGANGCAISSLLLVKLYSGEKEDLAGKAIKQLIKNKEIIRKTLEKTPENTTTITNEEILEAFEDKTEIAAEKAIKTYKELEGQDLAANKYKKNLQRVYNSIVENEIDLKPLKLTDETIKIINRDRQTRAEINKTLELLNKKK